MEIIELTKLFCGEKNWQNFASIPFANWENFSDKNYLIAQLNGDIDLAKVIAYQIGDNFAKWFDYPNPALDNKTPRWCIQNPENINGLKELLLRMG